MKAKACKRCRQSKIRCDSDVKAPNACSRCESLNEPCVVDRHFQAQSNKRRLLELEAEVRRLRGNQEPANALAPSPVSPLQQSELPQALSVVSPLDLDHKSLGNVTLNTAQVDELFSLYFAQYHIYLDFFVSTSPQTVYEKCPLLFWVICAVASLTDTALELQSEVQAMVAQIVFNPPRSVEVVQALLILCTWPFPFYSTLGDPSLIYCGIATQIAFQIGLHRPTLSQEFSSRIEVLEAGYKERTTTWLACYVMNQMQAGRLGVPITIQTDFTFFSALEAPGISATLIALCRISRITIQFNNVIGANGQNISGLLEPATRVDMVRMFSAELEVLQRTHFAEMSSPVLISFLTSRLQLWSYILHDDIPRSPDVAEFVQRAKHDAAALIRHASGKNLSRCPFHLARSVLYSALILLKIRASPYNTEHDAITDQIRLAGRTLSTANKVPDDHAARWCRHLEDLLHLQDKKRTHSIRSRMAASLMYDAIRVLKEHRMEVANEVSFPDGSAGSNWADLELTSGILNLEQVDWDNLDGLL